jgi:hypothetical protein
MEFFEMINEFSTPQQPNNWKFGDMEKRLVARSTVVAPVCVTSANSTPDLLDRGLTFLTRSRPCSFGSAGGDR